MASGPNVCTADAACDDGLVCNGAERCAPTLLDADAMGCVAGTPPACGANMVCDELSDGCRTDCATTADADGDGIAAVECGGTDCDDGDATRFPGNVETCDDAEGGAHDEDCDPTTFGARDLDGDGAIDAACCNGDNCGTDCDDEDVAQRAGQPEFCDGLDNDCDGQADEMTGAVDWYVDADGDGHGVPGDVVQSCPPVAGRAILDDDCDDEDGGRTPGRFEECNLVDDDCDGATDEAPFCDAVTRIGPEGGSLEITNGEGRPVIVTVPAGAVEMPTVFSLGEMPTGGLAPLESDQQFLDVPYRVQAAATPTAPLTWQLPFDADGGTDDVIVLRFDVEESAWVWAPGAEVEIEGQVATITLEVAELGIYAVVRDASPPFCRADAECSDGVFCNGAETCAPANGSADAFGCVAAGDGPCSSEQRCDEAADACRVSAQTDCMPGEYEVAPPGPFADRLCAPCPGASSSIGTNATECGPAMHSLVSISTSGYCGIIAPEGRVTCWGGSFEPDMVTTQPAGIAFIDIAIAPRNTICGIAEADGAIHCWDSAGVNPTIDEAPTSGVFTEIAGERGSGVCARRSDGELECWGGIADPDVPDVRTFAVCHDEVCWVRESDGMVACSGGILSTGIPSHAAIEIETSCYDSVSTACIVREDTGGIECWGLDGQGRAPAAPTGAGGGLAGVSANNSFRASYCYSPAEGGVACFGSSGILPLAGDTPSSGLYTDLAITKSNACARNDATGFVECWGTDVSGDLSGLPNDAQYETVDPGGSGRRCAIRASDRHVVCLGFEDDDDLVALAPPGEPARDVHMHRHEHACFIREAGGVACWGSDEGGLTSSAPTAEVSSLDVGPEHACAVRASDGQALCWGGTEAHVTNVPVSPVTGIVTGEQFSCALQVANGNPVCWGDQTSVVAAPPTVAMRELAAGDACVCGIVDATGLVQCWGEPDCARDVPTDPLSKISGARETMCGLLTSGVAVCWGDVRTRLNAHLALAGPMRSIRTSWGLVCGVLADSGREFCTDGASINPL